MNCWIIELKNFKFSLDLFYIIYYSKSIIEHSEEIIYAESNCGSVRLDKSIQVWRYEWVKVNYFNIFGIEEAEIFNREDGGFTIQHEINHNLGILITDKQEKITQKNV